jgi:hypothetical protein
MSRVACCWAVRADSTVMCPFFVMEMRPSLPCVGLTRAQIMKLPHQFA